MNHCHHLDSYYIVDIVDIVVVVFVVIICIIVVIVITVIFVVTAVVMTVSFFAFITVTVACRDGPLTGVDDHARPSMQALETCVQKAFPSLPAGSSPPQQCVGVLACNKVT